MAFKVVETFDDLNGKKIESRGESIKFSLNGIEYAIDLCDENAVQLRTLLNGYIGMPAASAATNAGLDWGLQPAMGSTRFGRGHAHTDTATTTGPAFPRQY